MEDHKVREIIRKRRITPGMYVLYMKYLDQYKYCIKCRS